MLAFLWAAAAGNYGVQIMLLVVGVLLGVLLLGLVELSFLGYLKLRELRQLWASPNPLVEPENEPDATPEPPAAGRPPYTRAPHLRSVPSSLPAASRNHHTVNAYATLRRNANTDNDLSA